jgi:hypothetical protein
VPLGGAEYSIFNLISSSPPERGLLNKFEMEVNSAEVAFPPKGSIVTIKSEISSPVPTPS